MRARRSAEAASNGTVLKSSRRPFVSTDALALRLLLAVSLSGGGLAHAQTSAVSGAQTTTGERRIILEGAANFRDLGGYPTADGRHVRWKKIYRSGELSKLTAADYQRLSQLGIAVVCDFRRDSERSAAPTTWQGANPPTILNIPGAQAEPGGAAGVRPAADGTTPPGLSPLLVASYPTYPTALASSYRTTLHQLATGRGAVLYHCTAGKDRTGTFSAILLTMLGVPRTVVMEDYLLTNQYLATSAQIEAFLARGRSRESAMTSLSVDRVYLESMFQAIDKEFGSFDEYRRKALGISDADLRALKAKLLE